MLYRRWTVKSNPAVLLLPLHPQISTLPLGCALGAGEQKSNPEHRGSCLEICATLKFGTGEILLGRRLWGLIFCPSTLGPTFSHCTKAKTTWFPSLCWMKNTQMILWGQSSLSHRKKFGSQTRRVREKKGRRKIREERRSRCAKRWKSRETLYCSTCFVALDGRKSAGAEPSVDMRDEKLHAVVARSTFPSQYAKNTAVSDHFWKKSCSKVPEVHASGTKHISKSKN